jgi:alkylated DNA repair protein (DNA oxidative demethylase)
MNLELFAEDAVDVHLAPGAKLLSGFARPVAESLLSHIERIAELAPFRRMTTPGGHIMSVSMTNCGALGWVSDRSGYRYDARDPDTGRPWPAMPQEFVELAARAAAETGFAPFVPDACLVNRYAVGAKMSLHQDKDERDIAAPIVSISLGLPAVFLFGGDERSDRQRRIRLRHGDAVVWGGPSRFRYHGILPLEEGTHPATGAYRFNLTFRIVT